MEPVLFVMAILGCGEGNAPCQQVAMAETRYQSEAACIASSENELVRQDALYPVLVAQCHRAGSAPRLVRANEVVLPEGGTLPAPPARYAARSSR